MVLVIIVVVSIAGSALAAAQISSFRTQKVYEERRKIDDIAENRLEDAIQTISENAGWGGVDGDICGDPDPLDPSNDLGTEAGIKITCLPDPTANLPVPGSAIPLPNTIYTTGGSDTVTDGTNSYWGNSEATTADNENPFCSDWAGLDNSTCEAGFYAGPSTATDDLPGGIIIAPLGNTSNEPVVKSNSSIIVRNGVDKFVSVAGKVKARWACDPDGAQVHAGYNTYDNTYDNTALSCLTPGNAPAPNELYPRRPHRLMANTNPATPFPGWGPTGNPGPIAPCTPNVTQTYRFVPGFYNDVAKWNDVMDCNGLKVIYFEPGAYYLGFTDAAVPLKAPPPGTQVIGGARPAPGAPNEWDMPTTAVPYPVQADKRMVPDAISNTYNWDSGVEYTDHIDDEPGTTTLEEADWKKEANFSALNFSTEVPTPGFNFVPTRDHVRLEVAHRILTDPSTTIEPGFPQVVVEVPNSNWGTCTVPLEPEREFFAAGPGPGDDLDVAQPTIDLTDGCNEPGMFGWANFNGWTAQWVNKIKVTYRVRRQADTTASVAVDGIRLDVKYEGLPAPSYPGACDPTRGGVQFVLGAETRLDWIGSPFLGELCGGNTAGGDDPYGFVFYGLPESYTGRGDPGPDLVPPPSAKTTADMLASAHFGPLPAGADYGVRVEPALCVSPACYSYVQRTANSTYVAGMPAAIPPATQAPHPLQLVDGYGWHATTPGAGRELFVKMPPASDFVPANSVIERIELAVTYATDRTAISGTCDELYDVVTARVEPGVGSGSNMFSSGPHLPSDLKPTRSCAPAGKINKNLTGTGAESWKNGLTTWSIGVWDRTGGLGPSGLARDDVVDQGAGIMVPQWALERRLFEDGKIDTAAGIDNPTEVSIHFKPTSTFAGVIRDVFVDAVVVKVSYRQPESIQPLRGCLTTRTGWTVPTATAAGTLRNGVKADVVPWDFGMNYTSNAPHSDNALGLYQGNGDNQACPLLKINKGPKFHVRGSIFAPTAALDLRGNDNDAPFVTGGIIARQLSAWRWKNGGDIAAFGTGSHIKRQPRLFTLTATGAGGAVLKEAKIKVTDAVVRGEIRPGLTVSVEWFRTRGGMP
ncbi:MAG: hypothetical protein ACT4OX_15810 [Actinomycetota bacterium]